jgi:hypothetical protein
MECLIVDDIDKVNWRKGTRTAETIFSKGRQQFPFITENLKKVAPPSPFYSKNNGFNRTCTVSTITNNDNR